MLKQRIITAIIAGLLLLALLFVVPESITRVIIAMLMMIAAWEWKGLLGRTDAMSYGFVIILAALILPAFLWVGQSIDPRLVFEVALAWWAVAFVGLLRYPIRIAEPVAWLSGILVIVPAYVALDWLYRQGPWTLLFMLLIIFAADIGAYFAGKAFGRVKLAPKISPGKTWEGVIGGMLSVVILVLVASRFFEFPLSRILPLALAVAAISIVGDLTVSMFKRTAGVKDSGSLFPGHGGFLDRADGVTAAAPVFALGLIWIGPAILGVPS